ncbi:putative Zn-dependent peptidase [Actinocorallia herbida]|uniref:Putative Zn-dependent peptidase n=1 Tax=Actinocorallia herbida TaxID=58109 RepID=A0A3N1DB35_9ACTN|nr:insulinase family protein [Actinocorallia herbida]ROO90732.1 putative Zn-dependent peptidase [Actinocorallia herbida]
MELESTAVDGVPAFHGPGSEFAAALVFRVGRADEILATSGITHLVEHLALHGLGPAERHFNGAVGPITTTFVKQGEPEEVVRFLKSVCAALQALPAERIEAEKQVLRAEAENRSDGPVDLLAWRYGPAGPGMLGYAELGVAQQTPQSLASWAGHWFTRGNAALAMSGPIPPGLVLELPDGPRRPIAPSPSVLPWLPASMPSQLHGVALHTVVERGPAASLYREILTRRLHQALRLDRAISYSSSVSAVGQYARTLELLIGADGIGDRLPELNSAFLDEIERIATRPVTGAELEAARAAAAEALDGPDAGFSLAVGAATDTLIGAPVRTAAMIADGLARVTPDDILRVARQARDGALVTRPVKTGVAHSRYVEAPANSTVGVEGRAFHPWEADGGFLFAGPSGVTQVHGPSMGTVLFAECRGLLVWPDGARRLFGRDGVTVHIEPALYRDAEMLLALVDRGVRPETVVRMPARERTPRAEAADRPMSLDVPARTIENRQAVRERLPFLAGRYARPIHEDPELYAVLGRIRRGSVELGLPLLAATRNDAERRRQRLGSLADAVKAEALSGLRAAFPDDPDLLLWAGSAIIRDAWTIRSDSQAQYVGRDQFTRFWAVLSGAAEPLLRAATLLPHDPSPWDELQSYGRGMQLGRPVLDSYWAEITRRAPNLWIGHYNRVQVLAAKWQGSAAEVLAFAEDTAARVRPGDPLAAMVAAAHLENAVACDEGPTPYLAQPEVHFSLARAADKFNASPTPHLRRSWAHQLFGGAFHTAGDLTRARHHLRQAGWTDAEPLAWNYAPNPQRLFRLARRHTGVHRHRAPGL